MVDSALARTNMIDGQLRPNKVTDMRLLKALETVNREDFVPLALRQVAYLDASLSLGEGRFLLDPMTLARLIQALELTGPERVLDIGTGTGYGAAVLAGVATQVVAVESDPQLALQASSHLQPAFANVTVITNALAAGYDKQSPYDAILIEGAVAAVPEALLSQLLEGGRLVAVIKGKGPTGQAVQWRRVEGRFIMTNLFDAAVPVLPGFSTAPGFAF